MSLDHLAGPPRAEIERLCQAYMDAGMRPPLLTVHADGVDVTERPDPWPPLVRDYRGPGRLEWVSRSEERLL